MYRYVYSIESVVSAETVTRNKMLFLYIIILFKNKEERRSEDARRGAGRKTVILEQFIRWKLDKL